MWQSFPKHYFGLLSYFSLLETEFCAEESLTAENLSLGHHSHPELFNPNLHQQTIAALGPPAKKSRLDYSQADSLVSNSHTISSSSTTSRCSTFPDLLQYFEQHPVRFQETNWSNNPDEFAQNLHHPSREGTSHWNLPMEYPIATTVIAHEPSRETQDQNAFSMLWDDNSPSWDANNLPGLRFHDAQPTCITGSVDETMELICRDIFETSSPSNSLGQSLSDRESPLGALLDESRNDLSLPNPTPSDQFFGPESPQV